MKIGNVIYENELINHTQVEYINYINEPIAYSEIDKETPTLYVGWDFMKRCNPNNEIIQNADILRKKIITNELYFEFSFDELKSSHVKGVDKFIEKAPFFYFRSKYSYINVDPIFFQLSDVQDLMDVLPKEINVSYQYKDEMLYLLIDNKISGLNLKMYEFFQFNIEELLNRILERTNLSVYDENGEEYQNFYKKFPNFNNLKRYLVVMLSK